MSIEGFSIPGGDLLRLLPNKWIWLKLFKMASAQPKLSHDLTEKSTMGNTSRNDGPKGEANRRRKKSADSGDEGMRDKGNKTKKIEEMIIHEWCNMFISLSIHLFTITITQM